MLPRPAVGYGVQHLGSDELLDHHGKELRPVRQASLAAFVFHDFTHATKAGLCFLQTHPTIPLSIVPIGFDPLFERLILIHGVIEP